MSINPINTPAAWNEAIEALRRLEPFIAETPSKHDRVDLLIAACIEMGIVTSMWIRSAVTDRGYHRAHVLIRLSKNTGNDPVAKRWWCDEDDCYHNHPG